jgi:uncharacterized protein GlcG (DUF336 family)
MFYRVALAAMPLGLGTASTAQTPPMLDARAAQAIVAGCVTQASGKMQSHAIVVVDTGGHVVAALRMDGNSSGIFDFALAKAEAAAAWGFSTAQMVEAAKGTPGFANAPHVVTVPGGVPVFSADGRCGSALSESLAKRPPMMPNAPKRASARRGCAPAILDPCGCASIGGACRKSMRTLKPHSKACCLTA